MKNKPKDAPLELYRMLDLRLADLTQHKLSALNLLRTRFLALANELASIGFAQEPLLLDKHTKAALEQLLTPHQKKAEQFNASYAQKAMYRVIDALHEQHLRYCKRLVGRLAHSSTLIDDPQSTRLYYSVPSSIEDKITLHELKELEASVKKLGYRKTLDLFVQVIIHQNHGSVTKHQVSVMEEIHRQVQVKHRPVCFRDDTHTSLQIHLDKRQIRSPETIGQLNLHYPLIFDEDNAQYKTFLELSHPTPRGPKIKGINTTGMVLQS